MSPIRTKVQRTLELHSQALKWNLPSIIILVVIISKQNKTISVHFSYLDYTTAQIAVLIPQPI